MFPKELPLTALRQVARFVTGQDKDYGRISLAAWQLAGFGLDKAFPDAAYLADSVPLSTGTPVLMCSDVEMMQLTTLANADLSGEIPEDIKELIKLIGPLLIRLLLKRLGITI